MASGGGEEEAEILRAIDVLRISEPFAKQPCQLACLESTRGLAERQWQGESRVDSVAEGTSG